MTAEQRRKFLLYCTGFNPYNLAGTEAHYSLDGDPGDNTYLVDTSDRLLLVADRSGNSAENCLVLNGASGNYASAPDSAALDITGDIDIRVRMAAADWTPTATAALVSKRGASGQVSYSLRLNSSGPLSLLWSNDGTTLITNNSTTNPPFNDGDTGWVRAVLDVDDGGVYKVRYYTSTDGASWTQLGDEVVGLSSTSIFNGTASLEIGTTVSGTQQPLAARIYRAQVYNGIAGTLVFDADFTAQAKLASSFTESSANAATVTINASGDLGARICGARDLYQATTGKMFIVSTAPDGKTIATADGLNDYMKAAPFALSQPESVYFVGSQVTWTSGDEIFTGESGTVGNLRQAASSPNLSITAGTTVAENSGLSIDTRGVIAVVFNGASSSLRVNQQAATTGNAGAGNLGGFMVGGRNTLTNFSNITFCEALLASRADSETLQLRIASYLMRLWKVT
jgi:hypothetical protein